MPLALPLMIAACTAGAVPGAAAPSHDFGKVVQGPAVEHVFEIPNPGSAPLNVVRTVLSPPLVVSRLPRVIPAGGAAPLPVRLDTSQVSGAFEGEIAVFFEGVAQPVTFSLRGTIVGSVEIAPRPFVVLAAVRGETKEAAVEIVSHEPAPLRIERVESPARFSTRIETLEPGRRFRLRVALRSEAPTGRAQERILVHTSSARAPILRVGAFTNVHERVYTFPDVIDLGAIRAADLARGPDVAARLAQTLMVYQVGGSSFAARFRTEMPAVAVTSERGPKGDRWQATVRIIGVPRPGPLSGTIEIETSDASFPRLTVPVTGTILE